MKPWNVIVTTLIFLGLSIAFIVICANMWMTIGAQSVKIEQCTIDKNEVEKRMDSMTRVYIQKGIKHLEGFSIFQSLWTAIGIDYYGDPEPMEDE